jgi:hypothetical protein
MADGVGIAPTQPGGSLGFQDRGITALPTIRNDQSLKMVSAAGLAPAITRAQTEHVAPTLRADGGLKSDKSGSTIPQTIPINRD